MTARIERHIPCEEVIRAIWDYLDEETDADLANRIRYHLEICPPCREHYEFEGAFLRSLSRLLDEETDVQSLRSRITRALTEQGYHETPPSES